jgi:hypothetical protein
MEMTNNKQQTAVEWLEQQTRKPEWHSLKRGDIFEQAKEMEKEQMDKVAGDWWNEGASYMHDGGRRYESFEQYYNETYGGNK